MSRASRYAVVLAGGSGTRFWPRSRARTPKQLLQVAGPQTLLQETVARLTPITGTRRVLVVAGRAHAAAIRRQLPALRAEQILTEPVGRSTAAAIALAALRIEDREPGASMVVAPSDHVIGGAAEWRRTLALAFDVAERRDALVTLGIHPTGPETGYGYIMARAPVPGTGRRARWAAGFIEKPDRARARRLLAQGALWNAGIFVWRARTILAALRAHLPAVLAPLERAWRRGGRALAAAYRRVPSISIDHGVLEHADAVVVVPARFPWSDVGSWAAVEPLWRRAGDANAVRGRAVAIDSRGCVVDGNARLVTLLGVDDLVIVDTHDALLVCRKDRSQDVRLLVAELKRRGMERYL